MSESCTNGHARKADDYPLYHYTEEDRALVGTICSECGANCHDVTTEESTDECSLCGDESTASKTLCAHCGLHFCDTENAGCFDRHEAGIGRRA